MTAQSRDLPAVRYGQLPLFILSLSHPPLGVVHRWRPNSDCILSCDNQPRLDHDIGAVNDFDQGARRSAAQASGGEKSGTCACSFESKTRSPLTKTAPEATSASA